MLRRLDMEAAEITHGEHGLNFCGKLHIRKPEIFIHHICIGITPDFYSERENTNVFSCFIFVLKIVDITEKLQQFRIGGREVMR